MTWLILAVFLSIPGEKALAQNCSPQLPLGKIGTSVSCLALKELLQSKGFVCDGQPVCRGRIGSYPEPVLIMIPSNYRANGRVHYHFHGHNLTGDQGRESFHFNVKSGDGDYLKFANEADFDSLMVFPLSNGQCSTFKEYFKSKKDLDLLNEQISKIIGTPLKKWSLSFHSGSDVIADRLLKDPGVDSQLSSVILFDALYGQRIGIRDALSRWAKETQPPAFRSYFVMNTSTAGHNDWLQKNSSYGDFYPVKATHMGIMAGGRMTEALRKVPLGKD